MDTLTINFISITSVAIPNPTVIPIKTNVARRGEISAILALGIVLKSNGNLNNSVTSVAIPNRFNNPHL